MITQKQCLYCNKEFECRHDGRIYCSNKCSQAQRRHKRKQGSPPVDKPEPIDRKRSKFIKGSQAWTNAVWKLADIYGWICWYCAKPVNIKTVSLDHIIPTGYGGMDEYDNIDNLSFACIFCQRAKFTFSVEEYVEWLDWIRSGRSFSILRETQTSHPPPLTFADCRLKIAAQEAAEMRTTRNT